MFIHVIKAKYLGKYKLELEFNNGISKKVDLEKELYGEVFEPLRKIEVFKDFHISRNTIEWQNGADFAPEYLYNL
jgi:hypothetical protein